jgi:hypothetical protein
MSKPTTLREIFAEYKLGFQVPPDVDINKHFQDYEQAILDLLESKAETLSTVEEKEPLLYGFVPVRAIPLTALKELGDK